MGGWAGGGGGRKILGDYLWKMKSTVQISLFILRKCRPTKQNTTPTKKHFFLFLLHVVCSVGL